MGGGGGWGVMGVDLWGESDALCYEVAGGGRWGRGEKD